MPALFPRQAGSRLGFFRRRTKTRCQFASSIDLKIAENIIDRAGGLRTALGNRDEVKDVVPPFFVLHQPSEDSTAIAPGKALNWSRTSTALIVKL
jgi:hypothetical protein